MDQKHYFQCQQCGAIHCVIESYDLNEDIYEKFWCEKCKRISSHLWVGNEPEDKYLYGNNYLDERYFIY